MNPIAQGRWPKYDSLRALDKCKVETIAERLIRLGGYAGSYTDAITDAIDIYVALFEPSIIDLRDGMRVENMEDKC